MHRRWNVQVPSYFIRPTLCIEAAFNTWCPKRPFCDMVLEASLSGFVSRVLDRDDVFVDYLRSSSPQILTWPSIDSLVSETCAGADTIQRSGKRKPLST